MIDAWQNLERDFAYWRVLTAAEGRARPTWNVRPGTAPTVFAAKP